MLADLAPSIGLDLKVNLLPLPNGCLRLNMARMVVLKNIRLYL